MSNKNRCMHRKSSANYNHHGKSTLNAPNWRKSIFIIGFKLIESAWMIIQILQYLREIFL